MFQGWRVQLNCLKLNEELLIPASEFVGVLDVGAHGGFHMGTNSEKFFRFFVIAEGLRIVRMP